MAPNNITLFIMFVHNVGKHLVCFLICSKLRLKTPGSCKTVFLRKSKIVEQRPQYIIAIAIVILMHNLFIKENRNAPLECVERKQLKSNIMDKI